MINIHSLTYIASFIAGMLSFFSPCILPLLPGYLSFFTGLTLQEAQSGRYIKPALQGALTFGLGFSAVFIAMGAVATKIGSFFASHQHIFTTVSGVIVIIFGLHTLGVLRIKVLYYEKKLSLKSVRTLKYPMLYALLLGFAFAFGWTPCIGPILGGILTLAAQQNSVWQGVALLAIYSFGLWLPFMVVSIFTTPVLNVLSKYPNVAIRAEQVAGILLIIMGVLMITGYMSVIIRFLNIV